VQHVSDLHSKFALRWSALLHRAAIKQSEVKVIEADNIGGFYNYVSKRTTYRSVIGALLDNDGDIVTDDKAKAELLKYNKTRMWASAHVMVALPNIDGALCSTPQNSARAHCSTTVQ